MKKRHPGLGVSALTGSVAAFTLAIVAAVLSAADSGTSFGPMFIEAERVWIFAAVVGLGAVALGIGSVGSGRGTRFGAVALAVTLLAGPVAIAVMDSLPPA